MKISDTPLRFPGGWATYGSQRGWIKEFIEQSVAASKADHSEAIAWLRRGLEANRTIAVAHFPLASRLARIGELEQARAAVQTGLALDPNFTIRRYQIAASASHDHPTVVAARERGIDGMRLAGVPEG